MVLVKVSDHSRFNPADFLAVLTLSPEVQCKSCYKGLWYLKVGGTNCYLVNGDRHKGCRKRVGQGMKVSRKEARLPLILSRNLKDAKDHLKWLAALSGSSTLPEKTH